jgi:XTP/dITP diphosphohydrolase
MSHTLVYGTKNPAKIAQVQAALKDLDIHVVGLGDLEFTVEEDGYTHEENARKNAIEYSAILKKPALYMDAAIYFDDIADSLQPGLFVRRIPGHTYANDNEMLEYYQKLINDHGGKLSGYWEFSFALGYPNGRSDSFSARAPRVFVSKPHDNLIPGYPLESLQIDPKSEKYMTELSKEEQAERWQHPIGIPLAAFIKKHFNELES